MAFIIRLGTHTARFYRRRQIPLGNGAYKYDNIPLGSLPLTTTELPPDFPKGLPPLSEGEQRAMEERFLKPARAILERRREEEQEQLLDPAPRLAQALSLMSEAAALSRERPMAKESLEELMSTLMSVQCADKLFLLSAVADVARAAADAANAGEFGTRGEERMSETAVAPLWQSLTAAINGKEPTSLMCALQRCKFVRTG